MKLFAFAAREYDEVPYFEKLSRQLGFEFGWTAEYPTVANAHLADGYDVLSIITNPMTPELLATYKQMGIKGIATRSIGYDHIDVAAARELGIRLAHASYPPEGVADYTVMMILMALRKVKFVESAARYQDFGLEGKIGRSLCSCTVGVIGTGAIGTAVCKRLSSFGCRILANDPHEKPALRGIVEYMDNKTLLSTCDVITLHAPGLPCNDHMIGAAQFAQMKKGVVLVNAARGALVDTQALIDAVESGRVGAAALDTIEHEANLYYQDKTREVLPNRDRAVLMSYPNVLVTPHMAFYTEEAVENMVKTNVEALIAFDRGEATTHEIR